jgi:hypothetical protein
MKKILFSILTSILIANVNADIIQVNNNEDASADYSLLQTAIDLANSGDTIYIAGSPNYYDGTTLIRLNKTLTLIGPGFFLGENGQTQASNQQAKIYDLEIGEGADNSVITGLDLLQSGILFSKDKRDGNVGTQAANNVTIKRSTISNLSLHFASGTIIEQNYFIFSGSTINLYRTSSNTLIQNNILICSSYGAIDGESGYSLSNTVVRNNTIKYNLAELDGVEIDNNIFINGILNNCDNNTLKNNVFVNAQGVAIPSSSTGNTLLNNIFSVAGANLFVEATPKVDNDYILKVGSPAAGIGIDGIDAGAFGGANTYKLSGIPAIPTIYELTTNGIGTKEEGLKVTIKAKSNN